MTLRLRRAIVAVAMAAASPGQLAGPAGAHVMVKGDHGPPLKVHTGGPFHLPVHLGNIL